MTQLGKFEKYLIEEFFDDYRAGALSQHTFTRRVAFITGSMAAAALPCSWSGARRRKFRGAPTPCPLPPRHPVPPRELPPVALFRGRRARCPSPRGRQG